MNISQTAFENRGAVNLESVISTVELEQRRRRVPDYRAENRALIALANDMVSSPQGILKRLVDTALNLCGAGSAGISLLEPDGAHFYWPAVTGAWAAHVGGGTPREYGPCGTVLDRDAPQLMTHPQRFFDYLNSVTPVIEELLLIPFYVGGKAVGTIWVVAHDTTHRFDAEDLRVMTHLGSFVAAAYQILTSQAELRDSLEAHQELVQKTEQLVNTRTAQLASTNESLLVEIQERTQAQTTLMELSEQMMQIQEDERRNIARDLHDTTGQVLAALTINLSTMQRESSPANSARFAECLELVSSATAEIRSLSYLLHPPLMDALGLGSAVKDYAEGLERRSGLRITVDVSEIGRLEGNREIVLFRIIQECLGNIHRHSGSSTASIRIYRLDQNIVLEVIDEGHGFDVTEKRIKRGLGLRSMQERLRPLGGTLDIQSDSSGTRVKAVLPAALLRT